MAIKLNIANQPSILILITKINEQIMIIENGFHKGNFNKLASLIINLVIESN